jgi:hypothetical protein
MNSPVLDRQQGNETMAQKKKKPNRKTRPQQHETNDKANALFLTKLPKNFAHCEQKRNDYGVDYRVEVFENEVQAGVELYVQQKGTINAKRREKYISYPLEMDDIDSSLKRNQLPAFLAVADLQTNEVYYSFLQEYIMEHLPKIDWKKKKSLTIKVPYTNLLSNEPQLMADAKAATTFMVSHKVRLEQWRQEDEDSRFKVEITTTGSHTQINYTPIKDVSFEMLYKGPKELMERFSRGYEIPTDGVEFKGVNFPSPGKKGTIKYAGTSERKLNLIGRDAYNAEVCAINGIKGTLTTSIKENRYEGVLEGSPLTVSITHDKDTGNSSMDLSGSIRPWFNQPVNRLVGLESFSALVDAIMSGADFTVEGLGETDWKIGKIVDEQKGFTAMQGILHTIIKASQIARKVGAKPILPDPFTPDLMLEIDQLHSLLFTGSFETDLKPFDFSIPLAGPVNPKYAAGEHATGLDLVLTEAFSTMPFLGTKVKLFDTKRTFSRTHIAGVHDIETDRYKVKFAIEENCRMLVQKPLSSAAVVFTPRD